MTRSQAFKVDIHIEIQVQVQAHTHPFPSACSTADVLRGKETTRRPCDHNPMLDPSQQPAKFPIRLPEVDEKPCSSHSMHNPSSPGNEAECAAFAELPLLMDARSGPIKAPSSPFRELLVIRHLRLDQESCIASSGLDGEM